MPKVKLDEDKRTEWEVTKLFFELIKNRQDAFSADDIYKVARSQELGPKQLAKFIPSLIRSFKAAGYIIKTDKYILSSRKSLGSSPLPLYVSNLGDTSKASARELTDSFEDIGNATKNDENASSHCEINQS